MFKLWTSGLLIGGAMMASSMSSHAADAGAMGWAHPKVEAQEQKQQAHAVTHHAAEAKSPKPHEQPAAGTNPPADHGTSASPHFMMKDMFVGGHEKPARTMNPHHGMSMSMGHHAIHWGYTGIGAPQYWGDLKEDYVLCKDGKMQSPVDISAATITGLPDIDVNYQESGLDILNNGHAIQVNYDQGSSITVAAKTYHLLQFHFHSPSEHTVGGKAHDMVAHLVHKADDGQLAVIGVMIDGGGDENPFIAKLWQSFPADEGAHNSPEGVTINVKDLLPRDMNHFNYSGSLTTPPCSEGVNWFVLSAPVKVSDAQLRQFRESIFNDARPVQPLNGRVVKLGN